MTLPVAPLRATVVHGDVDPASPRSVSAAALLAQHVGPGVLTHLCPGCGSSEHGAPAWSGTRGHVSVSYADGRVAVAHHGSRRVGVDVDVVAPPPPRLRSILTAREVELVGASTDPALAFTQLWCAKEAWTKALGVGMDLPFASLDFAGTVTGAGDERVIELEVAAGLVGMLAVV